MNDPFFAAAAIARIPGIEPAKARYRALAAGLSHRLWLVEAEDRKLVLRLDTPQAEALGLDRGTELAVLGEAGAAGLAPQVVFSDADAGMLVYEYLPGRSWTRADLLRSGQLDALAALLREVHALPRSGVAFDGAAAAKRYAEILSGHEELGAFARRCRDLVASIPVPGDRVCCHNDVVAENVLETPGLLLLDWEYACDNDPYFDLASVIAYHDLDGSQRDRLLRAYAASSDGEERERLELQLRLFDPLQWLWLAVRQTALPSTATRERLRALAARIQVPDLHY